MSEEKKPIVIVTHTLPEGWLSPLEAHCHLVYGPADAVGFSPQLLDHLHLARGVFTLLTAPVDSALLERARALEVVSNMAVGVDNIDLEACTRRGIPVGHTPGVLTDGTADLTMALLLSAARRLPEASQDARDGLWTTWSPTGWLGEDFTGATLGIVGFGKIGQAVARRAESFGMHILFTDRTPKTDFEPRSNVEQVELEALLERSDFVSLHVPLTPETQDLIDEQALKSMKSTAILVNTARGAVVDSQALLEALSNGWIKAAALDVTDPEPLPADHPLYALTNCLITPHIGSATTNTRRKMAALACQNLLDGLAGRRLTHCANPEVYNN